MRNDLKSLRLPCLVFLFSLILFSCTDTDNGCIEAEDFGNIETEVVEVYPYNNLKSCEILETDRDSNYQNISSATLKSCLRDESINATIDPNAKTVQSYKCIDLLTESKKIDPKPPNLEELLKSLSSCEEYCKKICQEAPSDAPPRWVTNNPYGSVGNSVRITPNSLIYLKLSGQIQLDVANTVFPYTSSFLNKNSTQENSSKNTLNHYTIANNAYSNDVEGKDYVGSYSFRIIGTNSRYNGVAPSSVPNLINLIRRNLVVFKKFPEGYDIFSQIPINGDPDITSCVKKYEEKKDKISCSEGDAEDNYALYNKTDSSKAHNFGTDQADIIQSGGYIRSNNQSRIPTELLLSGKDVVGGAITVPYSELNSGSDSYINFKITDSSCNNLFANISIFNGETEVFKLENLAINSVYSSENIPLYIGSMIKILPPTQVGSSSALDVTKISTIDQQPCYKKIAIISKKYHDILMPTSGFVQFKMKKIDEITPDLGEKSCKLKGRIINPEGQKKLIKHALKTSNARKAFIFKSDISFDQTPDPANLEVEKVNLGLSNYANPLKSAILNSSICNIEKYDLPNCPTSNPACSISAGQTLPSGCGNGDGISADQANYGGGGGGNIGGQKGKNGTSFINPEFGFFITKIKDSPNGYGLGVEGGDGASGVVIINSLKDDGNFETLKTINDGSSENYSINKDGTKKCKISNNEVRPNCVNFILIGGGGGGHGALSKKGFDGDKFEGVIDFSQNEGSSIQLVLKSGKGGARGKNDGSTGLNTASDNTTNPDNSPAYLKGGKGNGAGGNGGSASYIYIQRSDESHDNTRRDFVAIAGGGAGAGANDVPTDYDDSPANIIESSALGLRIAVKFKLKKTEDPEATDDHYYEYKYSKNENDDPLKELVVKNTEYTSEFFVRKGQIMRIFPDESFEQQFWDSGEGLKECGVGMIVKITPRPAVLCHTSSSTLSVANTMCTANYPTTLPTTSVSSDTAVEVSTEQKGCASTLNCASQDKKISAWSAYTAAGNNKNATGVTDSMYCLDTNCLKIECSGGSTTEAQTCPAKTVPSSCEKIDVNSSLIYTTASCQKCLDKILEASRASPIVSLSNGSVCYDFANSNNLSVHKFVGAGKTDVISEDDMKKYSISQISGYEVKGDVLNYGNLVLKKEQTDISAPKTEAINFQKNGRVFGLTINNSNFKDLKFNFPAPTNGDTEFMLDSEILPIYQNGEFLNITLCKESSEDSVECESSQDAIPQSNTVLKLIEYDKTNPNKEYFAFDGLNQLKRTTGTPPIVQCTEIPADEANDNNYLCFLNDVANSDEAKKYRLAFKIKDGFDNNYMNNFGKYDVEISVKRPETSSLKLVDKIIQPIIDKIDGAKEDDPSTLRNEKNGIASGAYYALISSSLYKNLLTLIVVLTISFYGMGYLAGVTELKHSEIIRIILKVGIVFLFTSSEIGFLWFEKFFIQFFKDSVDMLSFMVAQTFENSPAIGAKLAQNDFSNKSILFLSVDKVFSVLLSSAVQNKILALFFSSIWGWVYFMIIFHCILLYFYTIANSVLLFITCQIINSILLSLAPIIFLLIFFNITKEIFDNWIKALIGFSLQQIFLILTLSFFNMLFLEFLKFAIGYRVCWSDVLSFTLIGNKISLLHFWTVAGTNSESTFENVNIDASFGNNENMPSFYSFVTLWIIVGIMKKFIELFTNLAVSLSGGIKASAVVSDISKDSQQAFGYVSSKVGSLYDMSIGRAVSNLDNILFASGKIADKKREEQREQFAKDAASRVTLLKAGDAEVSKYKRAHGLELSGMTHTEQKKKLTEVRNEAIAKYADDNGIKNYKDLMNKRGLNYLGTNLFGAGLHAVKQSIQPGGNLINSSYDKKVKTSFSKDEAVSVIKRLDNQDKQEEFIKNAEEGNVKVERGLFEMIKNPLSTVVDSVKSRVGSKIDSANKGISNFNNKGDDTRRAIDALRASGEIENLKGQKTKFIKNIVNWTRSDKEKGLIRDKIRQYREERNVESEKPRYTSKSVIDDLRRTKEYTQEIRDGATKRSAISNKAQKRLSGVAKEVIDNVTLKKVKDGVNDGFEKMKYGFEKVKEKLGFKNSAGDYVNLTAQARNLSAVQDLKQQIGELNSKRTELENKIDQIKNNDPVISIASKILNNKDKMKSGQFVDQIKNEINARKSENLRDYQKLYLADMEKDLDKKGLKDLPDSFYKKMSNMIESSIKLNTEYQDNKNQLKESIYKQENLEKKLKKIDKNKDKN